MKMLDFDKQNGLIPAIIQHYQTGNVLMLGYMNNEAYQKTLADGVVCFYSRSKNRLWVKGETSNNFLKVKQILIDCDSDTLLIKAEPQGPTCHTGSESCFNTTVTNTYFLDVLQQLIYRRKTEMPENSYTTRLFEKGINKIAQKVGEEAVELIIEAKDTNDMLFLNEAADLMYHFLILLAAKDKTLSDVVELLIQRNNKH